MKEKFFEVEGSLTYKKYLKSVFKCNRYPQTKSYQKEKKPIKGDWSLDISKQV